MHKNVLCLFECLKSDTHKSPFEKSKKQNSNCKIKGKYFVRKKVTKYANQTCMMTKNGSKISIFTLKSKKILKTKKYKTVHKQHKKNLKTKYVNNNCLQFLRI